LGAGVFDGGPEWEGRILQKSVTNQNRRDFLKRAGLLPLAAASMELGRLPVLGEPQPIKRSGGPMLKVSLNAYSFSKLLNDKVKRHSMGMDLFELVEFCAKYNFDGFDATGYFFPGYPNVPDDEYVNDLKRKAFEFGIGISGSGVRNNFTQPDKAKRAADVEHIKQWVEVASRLGAPVLRVFADTQMKGLSWEDVAKGHTWEQVAEWIAADLKECAAHGKKYGVIIGVQNHGDFLKTGDHLLKLINLVDSEWCGAIVDTGYFKSKDPYEDMARVAPYAVNWQVKQSPFGAESDVALDLKKFIRIVRSSGYRGYLPIETLSAKGKDYDPFTVVPQFLEELRQAIAQTA
jgi:sugar phosphate isomerase/epimerase